MAMCMSHVIVFNVCTFVCVNCDVIWPVEVLKSTDERLVLSITVWQVLDVIFWLLGALIHRIACCTSPVLDVVCVR